MQIEFEGMKPVVDPTAFVAPTATLIGDVKVGARASIWFGAVLRGDDGEIVIGEGSCVQDNCVVHAGTVLGKHCHVTHGVILHGCTLEDGVFVGMNATILDGAVLGPRCMVAAGSVVKEKTIVPGEVVVAGVPATVKKELSGAALEWVTEGPKFYAELSRRYLQQNLSDPG